MYFGMFFFFFFFFSSRRRHTRFDCDWSSDVCSSDLEISVLSEPTRLPAPVDAMRVVVGRHGLMVRRERLVGLLLPQVAHERSEEHTSELQSQSKLVCRLLLGKKKKKFCTE